MCRECANFHPQNYPSNISETLHLFKYIPFKKGVLFVQDGDTWELSSEREKEEHQKPLLTEGGHYFPTISQSCNCRCKTQENLCWFPHCWYFMPMCVYEWAGIGIHVVTTNSVLTCLLLMACEWIHKWKERNACDTMALSHLPGFSRSQIMHGGICHSHTYLYCSSPCCGMFAVCTLARNSNDPRYIHVCMFIP